MATGMAHAKGYTNDIFISYARKDNEAIGARAGWVEVFHDSLETWLVKRRGLDNLTIWRDTEDMAGNTTYETAIEHGLEKSALFFAMHSRNYVRSDYCQKELSIFHRYNSDRPGGLQFGDNHRIFNILLNNIHYGQWPPMLEHTSGFPMHVAKGGELGDFTLPEGELFMRQLQKIVDAVERTLGMVGSFDAASVPQPAEVEQRASRSAAACDVVADVFIADTADSLYKRRERLIADLQGQGLTAHEDVPPPMEAEAHSDRVQQAMNGTLLSIHLLDQWPGRRIMDRRSSTYTVEQVKAGLDSRSPQLIWAPPELELESIEDEDYREFLSELEQGARGDRNYEFIRASLVDFTEIVFQTAAKRKAGAGAGLENESLLLDTHQKDQRYGFKVADLLSAKGIEVQFNQDSVDPVRSLDNFEQAIRHAKSLMIMCGQVAPEWLMGRIKKAVRVAAEQFDRDDGNVLSDIWIYLLPGAGAPPSLERIPFRIEILDNSGRESIDPEVLEPFFAAR